MATQTHIIEYRIGRNIGSVPMDDRRWLAFQNDARAILLGIADGLNNPRHDLIAAGVAGVELLTQWTEVHRGIGTWTGDDGLEQSEESAVVTLYTSALELELFTLRDLLVELAGELAARFEQDAIALVWQGQSTLVPAAVPVS